MVLHSRFCAAFVASVCICIFCMQLRVRCPTFVLQYMSYGAALFHSRLHVHKARGGFGLSLSCHGRDAEGARELRESWSQSTSQVGHGWIGCGR